MAQGPDPNRHTRTDPELSADRIRRGGGPGNPDSTRLGVSAWASALIALLVLVLAFVLLT